MRILTEKFSYGFIGFTIPFGILEGIDKVAYRIPNFDSFDIIGIGITIVLSSLLLFWELNKAVLSHYPSFLRLEDLGGSYYGLSSQQIVNGNPMEDDLKIMIRRRGRFRNLVRPRQLIIRMRSQYEILLVGVGGIILNDDPSGTVTKEGFKHWSFKFDESSIEENTLGYSFKIRYPKNSSNAMPNDMSIPICDIILNYGFGFHKKYSLNSREIAEIRHG